MFSVNVRLITPQLLTGWVSESVCSQPNVMYSRTWRWQLGYEWLRSAWKFVSHRSRDEMDLALESEQGSDLALASGHINTKSPRFSVVCLATGSQRRRCQKTQQKIIPKWKKNTNPSLVQSLTPQLRSALHLLPVLTAVTAFKWMPLNIWWCKTLNI